MGGRHHLRAAIGAAVGLAVAAVPAILADPAVRTFVTHHPWAAGYLLPAAGVFAAVYHTWAARGPNG